MTARKVVEGLTELLLIAEYERDALRAYVVEARDIMRDYSGGPCYEEPTCPHDDCAIYRQVLDMLEELAANYPRPSSDA